MDIHPVDALKMFIPEMDEITEKQLREICDEVVEDDSSMQEMS